MGTWGTALYQNDVSADVRTFFETQLRSGKAGTTITQELMARYQDAIADPEDSCAFWLALADTQWDFGRLEESVKDKALFCIGYAESSLNSPNYLKGSRKARTDCLLALKKKLLTPPPKPKRIRSHSPYRCPWKDGDVFAYQLQGQLAETYHMKDKYLYFVKAESSKWYPGHIVPSVYFYQALTDELMSLVDVEMLEYMPQFFAPRAYTLNPSRRRLYLLTLLSDTADAVPLEQLTHIGTLKEVRRIENEDLSPYPVKWADFDEYIIANIQNWLHI